MSTTPAAQSAAPAAGDLLDVVALDRTGTLVRSDGTLVRYYELIPQNPEVLAEDQQEVMIDGLGRALGALRAGETLQIYAVAAPIQLPELLTQLKKIQGLFENLAILGVGPKDGAATVTSAAEFILEGLWSQKRINRSEERGYFADARKTP